MHHKQDKNKQEEFKRHFNKIVNSHPKKEVFFGESRFETHSKIGHGWFKKGVRTQVKMKIGRLNFYIYSAVSPRSGKKISLLAQYVNTDCMDIFLEQMSKYLGTK